MHNIVPFGGQVNLTWNQCSECIICCAFCLAASAPFRIRVNFDEDEFRTEKTGQIVDQDSTAAIIGGEFLIRPGGIIGKAIYSNFW